MQSSLCSIPGRLIVTTQFTLGRFCEPKFTGRSAVFLLLWVSPGFSCLSQEASRPSLAGAHTAAARRQAALSMPRPLFKLEPSTWSIGAGLALQASDNIRLESTDPKSDLAFHPEIHTRILCPVSDQNVLNVVFRTGYSAHVLHPELNRFYIGPESKLNFDIYLGDCRIDLHDRCSLLENNFEDPTVVGSGDYTRLENALGAGALWDLNQALVNVGYDHINYISYSSDTATSAAFPDAQSDLLFASAGYRVKPGLLAGLEITGTLFRYATAGNQHLSDAVQCGIGPFLDVQLSEYLTCQAAAGYRAYAPHGDDAIAQENYGLYAHMALTHDLNQYLDYTLSGGKNITFALYGGTVDLSYARLRTNWHFIRKCRLAVTLTYEHGIEVTVGGETFDRFGPGISFERSLSDGLTAGLEYQFYQRASDAPNAGYTANIILARLIYEF